jgi:carbon-monoxide dehydrogenase medium subunit
VRPLTFLEPETVEAAVLLLGEHAPGAQPIAGGQSLLLDLKARVVGPSYLVSLAKIGELKGVREADGGELEIGATTTYVDLMRAELDSWHAEISRVAGDLADRSVRNMGTVGGALCQADLAFDLPVLAVGVDAAVLVATASGGRSIPADDFFRPGGGTVREANHLVTAVRFPARSRFTAVAFEKFRYRVFDAALVSVLVAVRVDDVGCVEEARIAVGGVLPRPTLVSAAASRLVGTEVGEVSVADLGALVRDEIFAGVDCAARSAAYQRELLPVLVDRALARTLVKGEGL